jgi:hypothetical protein
MAAERHEGRWQTRLRGRPRLIFRPLSRTGENPPYGILGEAMETSASFEARSAPSSYPTANERPYGSVRGVLGNRYPYRDKMKDDPTISMKTQGRTTKCLAAKSTFLHEIAPRFAIIGGKRQRSVVSGECHGHQGTWPRWPCHTEQRYKVPQQATMY